jgi:hypothetical protein
VTVSFRLGVVAALLAAGSVLDAVARRRAEGSFLGVAYDRRAPTPGRVCARVWNRADRRLFVPTGFGWGWTVNLARLWTLLRRATRTAG